MSLGIKKKKDWQKLDLSRNTGHKRRTHKSEFIDGKQVGPQIWCSVY